VEEGQRLLLQDEEKSVEEFKVFVQVVELQLLGFPVRHVSARKLT
jgi:hypothetical protein